MFGTDTEIVPGTVHLVDLEGDLAVKKSSGDVILRPPPSSNPNDPLRWSKFKKIKQFFLLFWLATFLAITVNWGGPVWTIWTEEWNCTFDQLNVSSALCFLFLGIGCVLLQPTAMKLGRRFVYLSCTVLMIVANIIGANCNSVQVYCFVNVLAGFAAAPCDSLVEISTTDVFFQHERASYLAWFILALYVGSDIGPAISGFIVDTIGWRWCFWLQAIMFGCILVIEVFYMEDTTFRRTDQDEELENNIIHQIKSRESKEVAHIQLKELKTIDSIDTEIPMRSYRERMRFYDTTYNDTRSWLCIAFKPFLMIGFPAILWGGLVYGAQMMWLSLLATTQSLVYSAPPYNFSASNTGLTNLAPLVGSVLGMGTGKIVDWITIYMSKKNNGIMEPEFRLYAMVLPLFTNAAGLLAYGLGSNNGDPWPVSVIVGQGFLGFAMSSSGTICLTYAIDCYHLMASEGLVLMLFVRNVIGMAFTFAIQPWLDHNGFKNVTWIMFALSVVINGSFILMILCGKSFRRWTKDTYFKFSDPLYGEMFKR